jgi:hypothetical protein
MAVDRRYKCTNDRSDRKVTPGLPIPDVYRTENVKLVEDGCVNMAKHIQNAIKFGVPVVVAINKFAYKNLEKRSNVVRIQMQSLRPFDLLRLKQALTLPCLRGIGARVVKELLSLQMPSLKLATQTNKGSDTCMT